MRTITEAAAAIRTRSISSVELTQQCLRLIEKSEPKLNAFLTVTAEHALAQAKAADEELAHGVDRGPLHGVPVSLKDLFRTKGIKTTAGSLLYKDYVPDFDCAVTEKLNAAGAVMIGKTGMHELAYGVTSNNPHFGPVRNPWNPESVPGGSSGGAGASIASGTSFLAMGTDTGGSIRIPAAFCGTVGLKPTFGLVSRYGTFALGSSLDHMGPLTVSVRDAAIGLTVLAGADARDDFSVSRPAENYIPPQHASIKGLRIGVPTNFYTDRIAPAVMAQFRKTVQLAAGLGAQVEVVTVPDIAALNAIGRVILLSEASALYERLSAQREKFGADVLALIDQGRLLPATDYVNAQRLRRVFVNKFLELFQTIDVLLTPTAPTGAPKIGQASVTIDGTDEDTRLAATRLVRGINVLGFPALSIPTGLDEAGMPLSLQIVGKPFSEAAILNAGAALEDAIQFPGLVQTQ